MRYFFLFICLLYCQDTFSQSPNQPSKKASKLLHGRVQSIKGKYYQSLDSLNRSYHIWKYTQADTLNNPYYSLLFSSPTLYGGTIHRTIGSLYSPTAPTTSYLSARNGNSNYYQALVNTIDRHLSNAYKTHPYYIEFDESIQGNEGIRKELDSIVTPNVKLSEKIASSTPDHAPELEEDNIGIIAHKPNFWKFKTNFSLQFIQNHVSDNWYKGGENYNSWLTSCVLEANYNNKQKIEFSNKLEMKIGFQSSKNDKLHKYKTNSDLLRMINKLGVRATKHWYYTLMLQSWTQFYPGYKSNDPQIYSDFMSPIESLFSIGMDYKLSVKNFTLNATISPLACDFKYVDRKALSTSFGLRANKHAKVELGSNITMNYSWTIYKNIQWSGRIYYFTDYDKAQLEWENTFNLKINKFLSTKLFLYPRFDDSVNRGKGESYIQFNETLSVGLDLSF